MENNRNQVTDGPIDKHGLKLDQTLDSGIDDATEGHKFRGALTDAGDEEQVDDATEGHRWKGALTDAGDEEQVDDATEGHRWKGALTDAEEALTD